MDCGLISTKLKGLNANLPLVDQYLDLDLTGRDAGDHVERRRGAAVSGGAAPGECVNALPVLVSNVACTGR
jgi:hypothetical protein